MLWNQLENGGRFDNFQDYLSYSHFYWHCQQIIFWAKITNKPQHLYFPWFMSHLSDNQSLLWCFALLSAEKYCQDSKYRNINIDIENIDQKPHLRCASSAPLILVFVSETLAVLWAIVIKWFLLRGGCFRFDCLSIVAVTASTNWLIFKINSTWFLWFCKFLIALTLQYEIYVFKNVGSSSGINCLHLVSCSGHLIHVSPLFTLF